MSTTAVARQLGGATVLGRKFDTDADLIDAGRAGLPAQALDSIFA